MIITTIIVLALLGAVLLFLEFFIIPGFTLTGVGGFASIAASVILAYYKLGNTSGHITLAAVSIGIVLLLVFALRAKTWDKLSLKDSVDGVVKNFEDSQINIGDEGVTISRLAPMGKVKINDYFVEAQSSGQLINENTTIEVVKISGNSIIVKPKNI
jgi:membrane-bound ClpP family serine protease